MNRYEKNCKDCIHFEACSKWTDFPKQSGDPTCSHFKPTAYVVELSCKVNDKVYERYCGRIIEYVVDYIEIHSAFKTVYKISPIPPWDRLIRIISFTDNKIGKTIFLTREEAENERE